MKSLIEQIEEIIVEQQAQKEQLENQELLNLENSLNLEYLKCLKDMEV